MSHKTNTYGFPQSWYPLCMSRDLKKRQIKLISAFNQELVVYRGETGKIGVLTRYCCHMGADMSKGKVIRDNIRCPLHHWQFNITGRCQEIPASESIPNNAQMKSFVAQEKYGIIFAFLGDIPSFEIPNHLFTKNTYMTAPWFINVSAPFYYIAANGFDAQHLYSVHDRKIIDQPHIVSNQPYHLSVKIRSEVLNNSLFDKILRIIGIKHLKVKITCWGSSIILVHNLTSNYYFLMTLLPRSMTETKVFIVALAKYQNNLLSKWEAAIKLPIQRIIGDKFIRADLPIINSMQFKLGTLLPNIDNGVSRYFTYLENLPKYNSDLI